MGLGNIVNKAKQKMDQRGGTESFKQDAQQLKDIAKGKGTLSEKAKRAQEAVKKPGAARTGQTGGPADGAQAPPAPSEPGPTGVGQTGATPGDAAGAGPGPTATDLPGGEERTGSEDRSSTSSGPQSPG